MQIHPTINIKYALKALKTIKYDIIKLIMFINILTLAGT